MTVLEDLGATVRAEGGLLANALRERPEERPLPGGDRPELALLLEAIREGELLHYGRPRIFDDPEPDLALLGGDRLYALGLQKLADLGDLVAVRALADVISRAACAHAEGRPEDADRAWAEGLKTVHRATSAEPGAPAPGQGREPA